MSGSSSTTRMRWVILPSRRGSSAGRRADLHPELRVRAAPLRGAVALGAHVGIVVHHGVEDGREQAPVDPGIAAETVEDELRDGRVPHDVGPAQHLEVAGDCGLRQIEHGLQVGDEERGRRQAVEDPEPGRLGDGEQQAGGGDGGVHIRGNVYTARRIYARADGRRHDRPPPTAPYSTPMLSLLAALVVAAAPLQDTAHVVLVATTDLHGHATDWDYVADRPFPGGLARVATAVDSLRARYPGQVVLVDAGDVLQGDPYATYFARVAPVEPHPIVEAMNLAGYDVATPGNHDFDWGLPFLRRAVADARFPYVSANLYAAGGDSLLYPPYRVVQRRGVRIAVTGLTTPGTMVWDRDQLGGRVRVGPIGATLAPVFASMRRDADVVVALAHLGLGGRASYDTTGV